MSMFKHMTPKFIEESFFFAIKTKTNQRTFIDLILKKIESIKVRDLAAIEEI